MDVLGGADRNAAPFMPAVVDRLGRRLAPDTDIARTAKAVINLLDQRLSSGEARPLAQALPELAPLIDRKDDGADVRFGFEDLIDRVVKASGSAREAALQVAEAVFAELRERLPQDKRRSIAGRLPADMMLVWTTPDAGPSSDGSDAQGRRHAALARPALAARLHVEHPILQAIERRAALPAGMTGAAAFVATLCLMTLRLTAGRAAQLRASLPPPLADLLFECSQDRDEAPTEFSRADYLDVLGAELGVPSEGAERVARAVFEALAEALPRPEAGALAGAVPVDLRPLWPETPE